MASTESDPSVDLKRLYELNEFYQFKGNKKKKKKHRKKKTLPINSIIQTSEIQQTENNIQYVSSKINIDRTDPNYSYFSNIFDKFKLNDPQIIEESDGINVDDDFINKLKPILPDIPDEEEEPKLSKKKQKQMSRMSIASLKQRVQRPEVVEVHDANSKEPVLLIKLKSYRNTAPVPKHWSYKRKYLQGKRGFVKPPFELPDNIKATGIMELRSAFQEKEDSKNLRARMKYKIRPKLGKGEIDYQRLHDAFFKYQEKPRMTMHGDLYYEVWFKSYKGKEFEVRLKQKKPGDISDDLRISLGMPVGVNKHLVPPPWLIAMQRYGPPPSYPNLKIPGLNAPIPEGATFGYHAGGWGKPPVDELGRPLYGDVFGTNLPPDDIYAEDDEIDKTLWGEVEPRELSSEESDEEMEDVAPIPSEPSSALVPFSETVSTPVLTFSTEKTGIEKVEHLELRKRKTEIKSDSHLYSVIPERKPDHTTGLLNTSHTYDLKNKKDLQEDEDEIEDVEMDIEPEPTPTPPPQVDISKRSKPVSKSTSNSKTSDSKNHKKSREFKF